MNLIRSVYIISLPENHEICQYLFEGNINPTLKRKSCVPADYYSAIQDHFKSNNNNRNDYKDKIYHTIQNLYSDLNYYRRHNTCNITIPGKNSKMIIMKPISISIPEQYVIKTIPPKNQSFCSIIPGIKSTYYNYQQEQLYYDDIQSSLFTLTYSKEGWDCMRHVEILSSGSIPLFYDIKSCPSQALVHHPKKLYELLLQYPGLQLNGQKSHRNSPYKFTVMDYDWNEMDYELYTIIIGALLQYTRNVLTTKSMSKYIIETIINENMKNLPLIHVNHPHYDPNHIHHILYITHQNPKYMDAGDYISDTILHGLIELYGQNSITELPRRHCIHKLFKMNYNITNYYNKKYSLYGNGFTIGVTVNDYQRYNDKNSFSSQSFDVKNHYFYNQIQNNIMNHKYDLIIFGSGTPTIPMSHKP
jgi:hypothetical protein